MTALILDFLRIVLSWPVMTAVVALTFMHRFEAQIGDFLTRGSRGRTTPERRDTE
jgi:hypothetical protein